MILFYNDNPESQFLLDLFENEGKKVCNQYLGKCSLIDYPNLIKIFEDNKNLSWLLSHNIPFIVIFENGKAVNFYNGSTNPSLFKDFLCSKARCLL